MDETLEHILFLARRFKKTNIRYVVIILLMELGVPTQYDGFDYLVKAIVLCVQDPALVMMKGLYNLVADQYDREMDTHQIEQAIRSAIDTAWQKGSLEAWDKYFSLGQRHGVRKPANAEFVSRIARLLELWMGCCDAYEHKSLDVEATV